MLNITLNKEEHEILVHALKFYYLKNKDSKILDDNKILDTAKKLAIKPNANNVEELITKISEKLEENFGVSKEEWKEELTFEFLLDQYLTKLNDQELNKGIVKEILDSDE